MPVKHLPEYVHQHLILIDSTHGAAKDFRLKANLNHEMFKRLVDRGYGRAEIVQRVIATVNADKSPAEITGEKIMAMVKRYRDEIEQVVTSAKMLDALLKQLCAWLMHEQEFGRKRIAACLGYSSISAVNHARQMIQDEIDVNREFKNLVYRIEAELEEVK